MGLKMPDFSTGMRERAGITTAGWVNSPLLSWVNVATLLCAIGLVALLCGRFWWPGSGSAWASTIRIFLLLGVVAAVVAGWRNRKWPEVSVLHGVCLAFWLYLLANSILVAESGQMARRLVVILAFLLGICIVGKSERNWRAILTISVFCGAAFAGVSVGHKYFSGTLPLGYRAAALSGSGFPGVADFGNTIIAGLNYAFCLIGALWLFFITRSGAVRLLWAACMIIFAVYIYFTFARASWVAGIAGVALVSWFMTHGRTRWLLAGAAVGVVVVVGILGFDQLAYEFGERGVTYRDEIWAEVLARMTGHWWFGYGAGASLEGISIGGGLNVVHNTHSLYLEVLYQFGLVGLTLLAVTMVSTVGSLLRSREPLAVLWLAVFIAMAAVMLVELRSFVGTPSLPWIWFWLPLGGALALGAGKKHAEA